MTNPIAINKKILKASVVKDLPKNITPKEVKRPKSVPGTTYKIKNRLTNSPLYLTINHMVVGEHVDDVKCHPYELFINSKDVEHYQWIACITRMISAAFKSSNYIGIINEMLEVFDPNPAGGEWVDSFDGTKKVFAPSLVAQIGLVIKGHLQLLVNNQPSGELVLPGVIREEVQIDKDVIPEGIANAAFCKKCGEKTLIMDSGCERCLSCDYSKCS